MGNFNSSSSSDISLELARSRMFVGPSDNPNGSTAGLRTGEILPPGGYVPRKSADARVRGDDDHWKPHRAGWFARGFSGMLAAIGLTQVGVEAANAAHGVPVNMPTLIDGLVVAAVNTPMALSASFAQPTSKHLTGSVAMRLLGSVNIMSSLVNVVNGGVELVTEGANYLSGQPVDPTKVLHGATDLGLAYTQVKLAKYIMSE